MKFTVGLPLFGDSFLDCILKHKDHVQEVYFSWGDFPNGRATALQAAQSTKEELYARQCAQLASLREGGIALNLLFNATCYGKDSQSFAFFDKVDNTVDDLHSRFGLGSVTTTSPLIAKFLKANFPEIKTRASVNMEIGTEMGMDYLAQYFDGYYLQREHNRDFAKIQTLHSWCRQNGKQLHILANSGCLNHCSAHVFHDNLVAHEQEISQMDNAYQFTGICREYLKDPAHHRSLIENNSFIRPEDVFKYEPYFDTMKLATRVHRCPEAVLETYIRGRFSGNLLDLLEPAHSIYPYVLENGDPMRIVKIGE